MFSYGVMSDRYVLVLVLAASAIGKMTHRAELAEFGRTLRVGLRLPMAGLAARAWVAVEAVTALALALPPTVEYAAALAVGEFGCLTAGAALLAAQQREFTCTCFGAGRSRLDWWAVLRNGALTVAALLLALGLRLQATATPTPVTVAAVLTVLLGAALVWHAGALRALLVQPGAWRPATSAATARWMPLGGRR